jgi:hypothetical protein
LRSSPFCRPEALSYATPSSVPPPRVRHHLLEGMRHACLYHTKMGRELAVLWAAVSSAAESALRRSPNHTFRMESMSELVAKFQKLVERRSWLECPPTRICGQLLGPPLGRARLANRMDKAAGQLRAELAALWSSLAASMYTAVELLEGRIDAAAAYGVRKGSHSVLVATMSHFP